MPLVNKATGYPANGDTSVAVVERREIAPAGEAATKPLSKDEYWRRREERDISTQSHIRRSGLVQAAGHIAAAFCGSAEQAAETAIKVAEVWLKWVEQK